MSKQAGKSAKRTKPNYFTSIISIALVLLIVGLLGAFLLQSQAITNSIKENVELQLELNDDIGETEIYQYSNQLTTARYAKQVQYVSKEDAAVIMQDELGENFIETLGFNPLFSSIKLNLNAQYANADSVAWIQQELLQSGYVKDVIYDGDLMDAINDNAKKLAIVIAIITGVLLIIALFLIDSTIKLAMFSNRFLVRSMQLVGATRWFITKPFILKGIFNGFVSGVLASLMLIGIIYYIEKAFLSISILDNPLYFGIVIGSIILLGMFISWISTHRAVGKYLRMKLDDLY